MLTEQTTKREMELRLSASKLSIKELNDLIDDCLDNENYDDASVYAKIYNRRVNR